VLKMLARSCLRSTRAVGAVRNGAVNTTKVRLMDLNPNLKIGSRRTGTHWDSSRHGVIGVQLMADY
jgi:hypothetical protein